MSETAPRALYEYRGNRPLVTPEPSDEFVASLARSAPRCAQCTGPVEKVIGGWWCGSCETAVA